MSFIRLFFAFFILIQSLEVYAAERKVVIECAESQEKNVLLNGWYLWDPYQYNKVTAGGVVLTGMDIELVKNLSSQIGIESKYEQVDWEDHQQDLFSGKRDMAAGATYTKERAEYVYFSEPYRYEENSLFIKRDSIKELNFDTVSEFLVQVRLQNFNLGVTKGFTYADPQINLFACRVVKRQQRDVEDVSDPELK